MKRILINLIQESVLRVALVDGRRLCDLCVENINKVQKKKSNIYKGKIIHIEPSLEAAFVNYGSNKDGFLPLKSISKDYFPKKYLNSYNIKDILRTGQECIVQIDKEERGKKGAVLTTFISLVGSYLILMPNTPQVEGISKKIEGLNRIHLKKIVSTLIVPKNMGFIVRTSGEGKSIKTLQLDLNINLKNWYKIKKYFKINTAPCLIYKENNIIIRILRDYLKKDVQEIVIDNLQILNVVYQYISSLDRSYFSTKIKLYTDDCPLFSYYQIESQIHSVFQRIVKLPSGGSIIIDNTEALIAIDVNSSSSIQGLDIEETAFNTNLEAVQEIAIQLRLRNLGGLIVIDFIDMKLLQNKKTIEYFFRKALHQDRARIRIGSISRFGLLEMSRQRLGL